MGLFNGGIFKSINKGLTKAWNINVQGTKLVGSALFPGLGNYMATQEQNEANKRLQERANQQNIDLWNRQTAYNDPAAQMKRLEAAGLSPQLAYGQLADSKASSPPEMAAPRMEAPHYNADALSTLSAFQQIVNMQEQNKKIRTDNALAAEALRYARYENNQYIKSGSLKGDAPHVKEAGAILRALGRGWDWIRSVGSNVPQSVPGRVPMHLVPKDGYEFGGYKAGRKY